MKGQKTKEKLYRSKFASPLGDLLLVADNKGLRGLYFSKEGLKIPKDLTMDEEKFRETKLWLRTYFNGNLPKPTPNLHMVGTDFQVQVWQELLKIPYGERTTYGDLAKSLEKKRKKKVSPQAVGGALGANPIPILVPCHRVLGKGDDLTGYRGGLNRKKFLLTLEGIPFKEG